MQKNIEEENNINEAETFNVNLKVLYAKKNSFDDSSNTRIHFHPFTEFYYIVNGEGTFSIEDKVVDVKKDDFLIINSNIGHSVYPLNDNNDLKYISLGIDSVSIVILNEDGYEKDSSKFFHTHLEERKDMILSLFEDVLFEFSSKDPYAKSMANAKASIILINILRKYQKQVEISHDKKVNKQIDYIKNYIDSNYSEDIKLEKLSQMAFMNKFHLISEFKQAYRVTPIEYLILKRIEITKNLLISTNHSMEEISSIVGFNSQSYFNQVFKKKVGITPSKFRKNHRI
jgi:AraC-like DNA-binding protein/mannose-6-phosphate isomerase-like protein (cupin superfamily)